MAANDPIPLTSLPGVDDLQLTRGGGYDPQQVREAFDAFRRHVLQLQAQLRVLQAAGRSQPSSDVPGHAVRMDALHVVRAATELADTIERDAQKASATQLQRTEAEITRRQRELHDEERRVERFREESERLRDELLKNAKTEARELLANANREAAGLVRDAEARGARLLEQSRHQATDLTNSVRAEMDETLEWARAQAMTILARAQEGAEQLLTAAGLGAKKLTEVSEAITQAAFATVTEARGPAPALLVTVDEPLAETADEAPADDNHEGPSEPGPDEDSA
jgi:cell division septum initiation protein DivIVA